MPIIHCPICNSSQATYFVGLDKYHYYRCGLCQHLFLDPMPSDAALRELYSGDYVFRVDRTSLLRFRVTSQKVIDKLKQLQPSGSTLLDIGAGYGSFVEVAVSNNLDAIGIEPAKNLHKLASRMLENRIFHSDLKDFIKNNTNKYDFISLIHVIEHVRNPVEFLTKATRLLKPGGVLYIETPNSGGHLATTENEYYTFLTPPDHINLFSKTSLAMTIDKLGIDLKSSFCTYSYPEHFVGVLRTIKNRLQNKSSTRQGPTKLRSVRGVSTRNLTPFFDRVVAPLLTPLLNIGDNGSFLQVFVQKKN